jgi:hypothetical protein
MVGTSGAPAWWPSGALNACLLVVPLLTLEADARGGGGGHGAGLTPRNNALLFFAPRTQIGFGFPASASVFTKLEYLILNHRAGLNGQP